MTTVAEWTLVVMLILGGAWFAAFLALFMWELFGGDACNHDWSDPRGSGAGGWRVVECGKCGKTDLT